MVTKLLSNGFRSVVVVVLLAGVGGCASQSNPHPFTPGVGESIAVPVGARLIAYGHYPVAQFNAPREAGSLYVWDMDTRSVAFMTTYPDGGMTATDLNQLSKNSFDPNHTYRVYYLPASATTSTQPANVQ
jgi:hypothetical protein